MNYLAGHELLSFLDAYKEYHHISISEEYMAKISFVRDYVIYSYTRMPFGLKKVGASFKERMNKTFNRLNGKIIEVYVDDIIIKSKKKKFTHDDFR